MQLATETRPDRAVWKFNWLTPTRCRLIFALVLLLTFANQWRFLAHNCPIDLSGDEAQYWDWSRHLDLSYYSKGPLIAYLIRASCSILGETPTAVRFPALILAIGTSLCIYWITRKLFASDKLALGAFLLGGLVPMYAAGSTLMTIDPPFFFFWALASCLAVKAILDQKHWAWIAAGSVVGLGFLTKYAMLMWLPFLLLFLLADRPNSRWLKTIWPWATVLISFAMTTPVLIWNAQHNWVSLRHVATQTGTNTSGGLARGNLLEFIAAQFGILNPAVAVLMAGAVAYTIGHWSQPDPNRRQLRFLLFLGLPFLVVCVIDALFTKVQPNWPAPAYFSLLILTAYFIRTRLTSVPRWNPWKNWVYGSIAIAIVFQPILRGSNVMYSLANSVNTTFPRKSGDRPRLVPSNFDLVFKLRGIADPFATTVAGHLAGLPPDSIVLCEDYQDASQLAFYLPGQPNTYFVGSYWTDPAVRRRKTQFDMWPDRHLDSPHLIGKDCIYVGTMAYAPLRRSFQSVEALPDIVIEKAGMKIHSFQVWRCRGFKGISRPDGEGGY